MEQEAGGLEKNYGHGEEEENSGHCQESNPGCPFTLFNYHCLSIN
jgi:hypothetical protein